MPNGAKRRKRRRLVDPGYAWLHSKHHPPIESDVTSLVRAIRSGQIVGALLPSKIAMLRWVIRSVVSTPRARMLAAQCLIDLEAQTK